MIEILTDNARLARWFAENSDCEAFEAGSQFFGLVVDGQIKAVFSLGRFCGADAELGVVTLAGVRWPRAFLNRVFHYAFAECGLERVTLHARDERAARLMERIGAHREGIKRRAYGRNADAIVMGLFPENYCLRKG